MPRWAGIFGAYQPCGQSSPTRSCGVTTSVKLQGAGSRSRFREETRQQRAVLSEITDELCPLVGLRLEKVPCRTRCPPQGRLPWDPGGAYESPCLVPGRCDWDGNKDKKRSAQTLFYPSAVPTQVHTGLGFHRVGRKLLQRLPRSFLAWLMGREPGGKAFLPSGQELGAG